MIRWHNRQLAYFRNYGRWLLPLLLCLTACGTLEVGMEPGQVDNQEPAAGPLATETAAAEPVAAEPVTEQPAATPTLVPTPTVATGAAAGAGEAAAASGESGVTAVPAETVDPGRDAVLEAQLPAPVYFVNETDQQIWRVEVDGVSLNQMTAESGPVTDFDVSAKDGSLVYLSANQLIYYSPALGGQRRVLWPAKADYDPDDYLSVVTQGLQRPRWSPDGRWIAFGEGGINLFLDPGAARQEGVPEVQQVWPSDPLPDPLPEEGTVYEGDQRWYEPLDWLDDGRRLLVRGAYYFALGEFLAILDLDQGSLTELPWPSGLPCCYRTWGGYSQQLLAAGSQPGMFQTGLSRIDPVSGEVMELVPGERGGDYHLFAYPWEVSNGRLYGFYAKEPSSPNTMPFPARALVMVSLAADGSAELSFLRQDYLAVGYADWLPDGRGAVIVDVAGSPGGWPQNGVLRWLASDGRPALALPARGALPHWGYMPGT